MRPDDPTADSLAEPPNDRLTAAQRGDAELVAACIDKEPGGIERLVNRCSEAIQKAADQALQSEAVASSLADRDDLYQEFCLELTRRPRQLLAGFKAGYAPLDCWTFTVALRICRKKLRLRKYRRPEPSLQIDAVDLETLPITTFPSTSSISKPP